MDLLCRSSRCAGLSAFLLMVVLNCQAVSWDGSQGLSNPVCDLKTNSCRNFLPNPEFQNFRPPKDYLVKMAYGRTFGTSTQLDYATVEFSKPVSKFAAATVFGPALSEVQVAVLASYVVYYEGQIEKVKRLDFHDGYEIGWIPKGRFTFPNAFCGMATYLESGAGLSYVSETFRNSGSRWNWSLLGGAGLEKGVSSSGSVSLGVQWRHLSNGNMWGKGDELHNSNSGTDMVQGMASFIAQF